MCIRDRPTGTAPSPEENRPFVLWAEYLDKLIYPDRRLTARQTSMIRYQAKTVVEDVYKRQRQTRLPRTDWQSAA